MRVSSTNCKFLSYVFLVLLLVPLTACAQDLNPKRKTIELPVGGVVFKTELALSDAERQMGLMYRTEVKDDEAMLFVFDKDDNLHFWMKNVPINLSIAYVDADGFIREIHDMKAQSLATVDSDHAVRYALETAQGAFERRGVKVGDRLDLQVLGSSR